MRAQDQGGGGRRRHLHRLLAGVPSAPTASPVSRRRSSTTATSCCRAAHGLADVESGTPLTPGHRFRIASHSKTFTATAVMRLVERGRCASTIPSGLARPTSPARRSARSASASCWPTAAGSSATAGTATSGSSPGVPRAPTLLHIAADDAAVLARNERFKYSNIGYWLLGQVIEAATGQPYARARERAHRRPLGLTHLARHRPRPSADHATGTRPRVRRRAACRSSTSPRARWRRRPASSPRRRTSCATPPGTSSATSACSATTPSARCSAPSGRSRAATSSYGLGCRSPRSASAASSATGAGSPASSPGRGSTRSTGSPSPCSPTPSTGRRWRWPTGRPPRRPGPGPADAGRDGTRRRRVDSGAVLRPVRQPVGRVRHRRPRRRLYLLDPTADDPRPSRSGSRRRRADAAHRRGARVRLAGRTAASTTATTTADPLRARWQRDDLVPARRRHAAVAGRRRVALGGRWGHDGCRRGAVAGRPRREGSADGEGGRRR